MQYTLSAERYKYLKDQIKKLEAENIELKKEIVELDSICEKKDKLRDELLRVIANQERIIESII